MSFSAIQGLIRHLLTFGGGFLVTQGTLDSASMETAVGAAVTLIGIVWSVIDKRNTPTV